jgi:hypothetical protein
MGTWPAWISGVDDGVGVKVGVGDGVDVIEGDGRTWVAVGLEVGDGRLPQAAHRSRSQTAAARTARTAAPVVLPALGRMDRYGRRGEEPERKSGSRGISDREM